jgi:multiple sugar transport system permease protein
MSSATSIANTTIVPRESIALAAAPRPRPRRGRKQTREALLFLSPWLVGFILFTAGPILASLYLSFCRADFIHETKWIGLANYQRLARDPLLLKSLYNTFYYAAIFIPLSIALALGMAMLLNRELPGMRVFRTIFYLPTLTQGVATFVLWAAALDPETGLINRVLRPIVGLFGAQPPKWLLDPAWVKPAIILMSLWSVGGMMLIFLAGLKNIPRDLYEAAEIDGAGAAGQFFNVTLPMLSPTIFFNAIIATIGALQVFTAAFILTSGASGATLGGPGNAMLFYALYLYHQAFGHFRMGYACAMAWLLFVIVLALTLVQIWLGKKWVHYG